LPPHATEAAIAAVCAMLRPGVTEEMLEAQANAKTPNQAAREMQEAKVELEKIIHMSLPEEMS